MSLIEKKMKNEKEKSYHDRLKVMISSRLGGGGVRRLGGERKKKKEKKKGGINCGLVPACDLYLLFQLSPSPSCFLHPQGKEKPEGKFVTLEGGR